MPDTKHPSGETFSYLEKDHKTIIFVIHSVDGAVFLADRIVVMGAEGGIVDVHDVDMPAQWIGLVWTLTGTGTSFLSCWVPKGRR